MKLNEVKNEELQNLKTDCNKCTLRKRDVCPYLEEVANCRMFDDRKVRRYSKASNKRNIGLVRNFPSQ